MAKILENMTMSQMPLKGKSPSRLPALDNFYDNLDMAWSRAHEKSQQIDRDHPNLTLEEKFAKMFP